MEDRMRQFANNEYWTKEARMPLGRDYNPYKYECQKCKKLYDRRPTEPCNNRMEDGEECGGTVFKNVAVMY